MFKQNAHTTVLMTLFWRGLKSLGEFKKVWVGNSKCFREKTKISNIKLNKYNWFSYINRIDNF